MCAHTQIVFVNCVGMDTHQQPTTKKNRLRSEEAMAKREEDAKAWRDFVAGKLVPRLQRDKERAGTGYSQVCMRACVSLLV